MKRVAIAAVLAALALSGCAERRAQPQPAAAERQCWDQDARADGTREGPFACAGDGVTPIRGQPLSR